MAILDGGKIYCAEVGGTALICAAVATHWLKRGGIGCSRGAGGRLVCGLPTPDDCGPDIAPASRLCDWNGLGLENEVGSGA
jgi:hypothetical protein